MNTQIQAKKYCIYNPPSLIEIKQYNSSKIDEQDEISYEHNDETLNTDDDVSNSPLKSGDSRLASSIFFKKQSLAEADTFTTQYSRINQNIKINSASYDYLNHSSLDNLSSDMSRSPSPLKIKLKEGYSPDAKRRSLKSFLKVSIPMKKQSAQTSIKKTYQDKYINLEKIGQGSLGEVRRCKCNTTQQEYAVKTISFKDGEQLLNISREFFLLQSLKHPNIIQTHDFIIERQKCYIILDYVVGFSLQEFLNKYKRMSEEKTKFVIMEAIKAVQYLHQKGVCHRDITSNNILIDKDKHTIKIIDFSNSKSCSRKMMTKTGTLSFMAPEMFNEQEYGKQVDLWSIGVVMYQMLTGQLPFYSESELGLIQDIQNKDININPENSLLQHISSSGIDFLYQILQKNPKKRLSSSQALCHPWLKQVNLMCQFKSLHKRGSYLLQNNLIKSTQNISYQEVTLDQQDHVEDYSNSQISHQIINNQCNDDQINLNCSLLQDEQHQNIGVPMSFENNDSSFYDDSYKNQQIQNDEKIIIKPQSNSFSFLYIAPTPINQNPNKHSAIKSCNKSLKLKKAFNFTPEVSISPKKFTNNNDTNFNTKAFTDISNLDVRARSRSSIYYSQILS